MIRRGFWWRVVLPIVLGLLLALWFCADDQTPDAAMLARIDTFPVVLVDGVGHVRVIVSTTAPGEQVIWAGRAFAPDSRATINDWPVYRLIGYSFAPIRWR